MHIFSLSAVSQVYFDLDYVGLRWIVASVVLFIISYQRSGFFWLAPLIHALISDLGLESTLPSSEGYHFHIFLV